MSESEGVTESESEECVRTGRVEQLGLYAGNALEGGRAVQQTFP